MDEFEYQDLKRQIADEVYIEVTDSIVSAVFNIVIWGGLIILAYKSNDIIKFFNNLLT